LPPAEEAFSVYDHPRVVIYKKTADFAPDKVSHIVGQTDFSQMVRLWPTQATAAPTALMLDPQTRQAQQTAGTWSELYDRASLLNQYPGLAIIAWWVLLALLGVLAWPIVAYAWPGLPDGGWGLARPLGLLIAAYLGWLAASLRVLTFSSGTLVAAILVLAIIGGVCLYLKSRKQVDKEQGARDKEQHVSRNTQYAILTEEALFASVFAIFLLIRYANGDLWHFWLGGERPMDFAYLNAILKTSYFPPYDPWFAGGQMNYYYFGFVLVSVPIKLLGIVPALAYNIALPMLAALTALGAFSAAYNLFMTTTNIFSRNTQYAIPVGLLAALFVVFMGNLGEIKLILDGLAQMDTLNFRSTIPGLEYIVKSISGLIAMVTTGQSFPARLDWWYWNASRIMTNGEINEFPFFTFLYSDLHAHMIALPLTLLMLGIGLGWALRRKWDSRDAWVSVLIGAIVTGAARANNTWDYPTYLAIALIALFVSSTQAIKSHHTTAIAHALISGVLGLVLFVAAWMLGGINNLATFCVIAVLLFVPGQLLHRLIPTPSSSTSRGGIDAAYIAIVGLSILYFQPYIQHYATAYFSIEPWPGPRSPLNAFILIHGIFLFPLATYLLAEIRRLKSRWFAAALQVSRIWIEMAAIVAIILFAVWIALAVMDYTVILIIGPLTGLTIALLIRPRMPAAQRFALLLALLALVITFAVEVIVLRGDIGRMNTVFKFYLQVWLILSVVTAVMVGWLAQSARRWQPDWWLGWRIAMGALVVSGLLYPLFATRAKIQDRFDPSLGPTLDAMKFMTVARANEQNQDYAFADEYAALIWMQDNIPGTPVVAESAAAPEYRSLRNRVTTYTGLPAIIGYNWHQKQQRSILPGDLIDRRVADANELYTTPDIGRTMQLVRRYNVRYIMAGYPEKLYYPPESFSKLNRMVDIGWLRVAYTNNSVAIYEVIK
jgi:YYY domain-containing protein